MKLSAKTNKDITWKYGRLLQLENVIYTTLAIVKCGIHGRDWLSQLNKEQILPHSKTQQSKDK